MRYLSVCSGIEAATCAWHDLGWQAAAYSEIEAFPSAVLAHHYPNVPNMGDMTKYKEWNLDSIGLLVGGTPCQSFSVAGLRKGMDDPRGNLALVYCGILDYYRPQWFIWENVPGVLSSSGGRDFGAFLGALGQLGYGYAYRELDAQYWGVAQRRKRIFVVGYLGDWRPCAAVLFESKSLSRDTAPSRPKRQNPPGFLESSFGGYRQDDVGGTIKASGGVLSGGSETFVGESRGGPEWPAQLASTLNARFGSKLGLENQHINSGAPLFVQQPYEWHNQDSRIKPVDVACTLNTQCSGREGHLVQVFDNHRADARYNEFGEVCCTITSHWGTGGGNIPIALAENTIGRKPHNRGNGDGFTEGGPMYTLNATGVHGVAMPVCIGGLHPNAAIGENQAPTLTSAMGMGGGHIPAVAFSSDQSPKCNIDQANTLTATDYKHNQCVAQPILLDDQGGSVMRVTQDGVVGTLRRETHGHEPCIVAPTLTTNDPSRSPQATEVTQQVSAVYAASMAIRRLTPIECERLQGFPDNYTQIPWKGKDPSVCPDGPRYKALGNSMAVPVMRWIGSRIQQFIDRN